LPSDISEALAFRESVYKRCVFMCVLLT